MSQRTETCHSFCLNPTEERRLKDWQAKTGQSVNGLVRSLLKTFFEQGSDPKEPV